MEQKLESPEKKYLDMQLVFIGGAAIHNLKCWLCKEAPAVYNMHPNWVFEPCWKCQEKMGGKIFRVRNPIVRWFVELLTPSE